MKHSKVAGFTAVPVLLAGPLFAAERSNMVFIVTDQQSYYLISAITNSLGASSPYGNDNNFSTPNLDRLVKAGYTFSNCYVGSPLSVPSRFALFTGESPAAYGVTGNISPQGDRIPALTRSRAMGTLFKNAGYRTYYGGKVHLPLASGHSEGKSLFDEPSAYGFDNYITADDRDLLAQEGAKFFSEYRSDDPFLLVLSFINPHDICRTNILFNEQQLEDFPADSWDARSNQIRYRGIYRSMDPTLFDGDQLAGLPFNMAPTKGFPMQKIGRTNFDDHKTRVHRWFYYRLVEEVDREIGKVLDAIDASPYKDNTVIVFTSDHGDMGGSHGLIGKVLPYEEAQRVPLIFVGKGIGQGVMDHTSPVNNGWDLLPTMLDLAGIEKPGELRGVSLYDRITGGGPIERKYLYYETTRSRGVLADGRYKYTRFVSHPSLELVGGNEVLIDLEKDPGELYNLAGDKSYISKLKELRAALAVEMELRGISEK